MFRYLKPPQERIKLIIVFFLMYNCSVWTRDGLEIRIIERFGADQYVIPPHPNENII